MMLRPLLMRGPLVRATLEGRKSVTRRTDMRWLKVAPGDLIYVKETWGTSRLYDGAPPRAVPPDARIWYAADGKPEWAGQTRVSLFMQPRFARLWLEIVSVRKERLQQITPEDAGAEGLKAITKDGALVKYGIPDRDGLPGTDDHGWQWQDWNADPRAAFRRLWDSINGADEALSWGANPFVVRIAFKRAERPANV